MHAVDVEVVRQVDGWLQAGTPCWLCTVTRTWGSSPRPVGSLLTCDADGTVVGSLSGGCVEDDLLAKIAAGELAREQATIHRYGLDPEDTERLGLPCGGHLHIVIEPLRSDAATRAHFAQLRERMEQRQPTRRTLDLATGAMALQPVTRHEPLRLDEQDAGRPRLEQTYGPRRQLFVIGAGMVSMYLAQIAQMLDYQVTVVDPREHLLNDFAVEGTRTLCMMPDDAVREFADDPDTAIVALTHDPRIDDMAMMEALTTRAFYVGAMGSTRTSAARRERLAQLDLTAEQIDRLHAPVGLPIGSKTPPEIAIAILAEITAVCAGRSTAAAAVPLCDPAEAVAG